MTRRPPTMWACFLCFFLFLVSLPRGVFFACCFNYSIFFPFCEYLVQSGCDKKYPRRIMGISAEDRIEACFSLADSKKGGCSGCRCWCCWYGCRRFRPGNILGFGHYRWRFGGHGRRNVRYWLNCGRGDWRSRDGGRRNWLDCSNDYRGWSSRSWRRGGRCLNCRRKGVSWKSVWSILPAANGGGRQSSR